ncbi:hypothetical protein FC24_GL000022 [Loigolactobacillus rennini DSM 20253]|uniref:Uncharacterized protein n=1 Tax=Loigolactobacillus rennini DSM 20253 TaxID=1423796 RepID=A0A0R2D8N1_9LACO|nr:hypothetical protein FC24_GL000022 [Loigolactobacillus rennini DSM 20253]
MGEFAKVGEFQVPDWLAVIASLGVLPGWAGLVAARRSVVWSPLRLAAVRTAGLAVAGAFF